MFRREEAPLPSGDPEGILRLLDSHAGEPRDQPWPDEELPTFIRARELTGKDAAASGAAEAVAIPARVGTF